MTERRRALVAVDVSEHSPRASDTAVGLANKHGVAERGIRLAPCPVRTLK